MASVPHWQRLNLPTIDLQALQGEVHVQNGVAFKDALIGLHAFTGCDSVSGLHGKGKNRFKHLNSAHGKG